MGLAPLDVPDNSKEKSDLIKDDLGEFHHKPAPNIRKESKSQKIREKLGTLKEKRQIENKLLKVKTLGESDSEGDDATTWTEKSRQKHLEKKKADERVNII